MIDSNAPYNEVEIPEREVKVLRTYTLQKVDLIKVSNYIPGDVDEDGKSPDDFSITNFAEEIAENDLHTPQQLIKKYKELLIRIQEARIYPKEETDKLIAECSDWEEVDEEFEIA